MKLNRTQALFLVGTIAAVGCVVDNSDDDSKGDDDSNAGEGGTSGSGTTTGGASGKGGTYTGGTSGSGGQGGDACMDETGPQVACGDFMEPGAGGVGSGGIGAGGIGYGGAGGAGPSCEGMGYLQSLFCTDLWTNFKPGVANAARTCMNAQTPEDLCTWAYSFGCASEAILAACPDDTADDECETITTACPTIAAADCGNMLSGMTQAGRDMVVGCAAEGLYCDLWVCAGVASPAGE